METAEAVVLTFLVNAVWQVPLVVALGALLARGMRRAPAAVLHRIWLLVLTAVLLVPAVSALAPGGRAAPHGRRAEARAPASDRSAERDGGGPALEPGPPIEIPRPGRTVGLTVIAAWGLSLAFGAGRLLVAARSAKRLGDSASLLPPSHRVVRIAERAREELGAPEVSVRTRGALDAPVTLGIRRPVIVVPDRLIDDLPDDTLRSVLLHEMAHAARRDYVRHLAAEAALLPLAFHPALRPLKRGLAATREMACDDAAASRTGDRVRYARSLLEVAARIGRLPRPRLTMGVLDAPALEVRMRRLLDTNRHWTPRRAASALVATGAVLATMAQAASSLAVGVSAGPAGGGAGADPARYAGTWRGLYDEGLGAGLPGATLTVALVDGEPRAAILMNRHVKKSDGTMESTAHGLPILAQSLEGGALTFRTRDDNFQFRGGPRSSVDYEWRFDLLGPDTGTLAVVSNSYFASAKERGEKVPGPPPPMRMTRVH